MTGSLERHRELNGATHHHRQMHGSTPTTSPMSTTMAVGMASWPCARWLFDRARQLSCRGLQGTLLRLGLAPVTRTRLTLDWSEVSCSRLEVTALSGKFMQRDRCAAARGIASRAAVVALSV